MQPATLRYRRGRRRRFAYIDATAALGMIVEPIEPPSSLPPPDSIWPPGS